MNICMILSQAEYEYLINFCLVVYQEKMDANSYIRFNHIRICYFVIILEYPSNTNSPC